MPMFDLLIQSFQLADLCYYVFHFKYASCKFLQLRCLVNDSFPVWFVDNCRQWYDEAGQMDIVFLR